MSARISFCRQAGWGSSGSEGRSRTHGTDLLRLGQRLDLFEHVSEAVARVDAQRGKELRGKVHWSMGEEKLGACTLTPHRRVLGEEVLEVDGDGVAEEDGVGDLRREERLRE